VSARTQYQSVVTILFAAQAKVGVSIVLTSGLLQLSPRSQAFFMTKHCLSFATWSALRKSYGGNTSGFSSRKVVQSAARTIAEEPGRQTWTDDRGAHLVSLRDALECLLAELTSSGQFRERLVRGQDGQSTCPVRLHIGQHQSSRRRPTPTKWQNFICAWDGTRGAEGAQKSRWWQPHRTRSGRCRAPTLSYFQKCPATQTRTLNYTRCWDHRLVTCTRFWTAVSLTKGPSGRSISS